MNRERRRDLDNLFAGLDAHETWSMVLLFPNRKVPNAKRGAPWRVTRDKDYLVRYLEANGNIGLKAGRTEDLMIGDIDNRVAYAELEEQLGPLAHPAVVTASGKLHLYTTWAPHVPGKLVTPGGAVVGEPRRGETTLEQPATTQQMAVCPPSMIDGQCYRFLSGVDLAQPLPEIPEGWQRYFRSFTPAPSATPRAPLDPGTVADRVAMALQQPGAIRRGGDIKFRCPACAALGRDTAADNARLFRSGGWGCAVFPRGIPDSLTHWRAIGIALGVLGLDGRATGRAA